MATSIDPATGRHIAATGVDQVDLAASPAAAAAAGINVPTMTHPLIRATVLNPYDTPTQDEAMTDAPTTNRAQRTSPSPHYVEAGIRSTFYAHCKIWFHTCVLNVITAFENTVYERDKEHCIAKAMLPVELDRATAKVAKAVESERQADRSLLRDMVRQEINKVSEKKDKEIKSLKAQLKQLKVKPSKKGNNNNTSKNFRNGGGLSQKNRAKNQSRAGTEWYKPTSGKGSGNKPKGEFKNKPAGKKASSKSGKRN